jgi:hypothetical protein
MQIFAFVVNIGTADMNGRVNGKEYTGWATIK